MAVSSSTSSSEPRLPNEEDRPLAAVRASRIAGRGVPLAFVGALVILAGVEVALRASGWPRQVPYDLGRMEYFVAAAELNRAGPAEVSIVGSSRTRESLIVPNLTAMLSRAAGRSIRVASYASSGAHTSDFEAMTRRIMRDEHKPRIVLCGVSERDLIVDSPPWDEVPTFWNFADWRAAYHERGRVVFDDLPTVIRNEIGTEWRTLGEREVIRFRLGELARGQFEDDPPSPPVGGLTIWQRTSPTRTLAKEPPKRSRILERAQRLKAWRFPDEELHRALQRMAQACQQANVPLVFYEMNMSAALRSALPKGLYRRFLDEIEETSTKYGARFVRLADLGLDLNDNDMREPSHMNYGGAEKLTDALCAKVVAPALGLTVAPASHPAIGKSKKRK